MKNLNKKGFTLIELLAVITIMGVLMVVAIPTVGRTIENSRKDTFLDTAKQYVNSVKNMWASDSLVCGSTMATAVPASSVSSGNMYYVMIDSSKTSGIGSGTKYPILLESGGKSSWSNLNVKGYVKIKVDPQTNGGQKLTYSIRLTDGIHGIKGVDTTSYTDLKRGNVLTSGAEYYDGDVVAGAVACFES